MKDGLYQVNYKNVCAGFIVEDSIIIRMAPILRRKINWWKTIAKRISD